jgi:serine/threonine protein kinase
MHSQHFIHGDIKPSNTLLQKGKAVFCDLGSALAMDSYRYAHHETHTLRFLSPEAATKKEYGQPFDVYDQDVYALGYTLLLFLAPEIGHSLDERMPIHTALSKVRGQISPELYNILHKIIYPESGVRPSIAEVQQVWGQAIGAPPDAPSSATTTTQPATRDKGKRPA